MHMVKFIPTLILKNKRMNNRQVINYSELQNVNTLIVVIKT